MAECKHENQFLMGTNEGIVCRKCGALFLTFDELRKTQQPQPVEADEPKTEAPAKKTTKRGRKQA